MNSGQRVASRPSSNHTTKFYNCDDLDFFFDPITAAMRNISGGRRIICAIGMTPVKWKPRFIQSKLSEHTEAPFGGY